MMRSDVEEIARRRTFAIISHPDAGKTTLTEKLLLYGGAIQLAGSVRARRNQPTTTSDWMELEKERGISVSSTLLQFDYGGCVINLLDTPGHKDFSEDTYRVLTAVDSVIMVIDAAKGIEERTRKLFEICRLRGIPIFTFMNKMDRPAQEPLALLDDLERVLGIGAFPVTWPLGSGAEFQGVYDRLKKQLHLFERTAHGSHRAPTAVSGADDPRLRERIPEAIYASWSEELEMLAAAGEAWDEDAVMAGQITPVFFGSGITNFGVQLLLDYFVEHGAPPRPRRSGGEEVPTTHPAFSGFVFKVQANMNPRHRDRLTFVRVCSGRFEKDMTVIDPDGGKPLRLSYTQKLFGQERESVDVAVPGDIIGLVMHRSFRIGDTLTTDASIQYNEIPRFPPEVFATLRSAGTAKMKQYQAGMRQLLDEGVVQTFTPMQHAGLNPVTLLGAVGVLQFEVVLYRLETEYGAPARLEPAPYSVIRWFDDEAAVAALENQFLGDGVLLARDARGHAVILFPDAWKLEYFQRNHADCVLHKISPLDAHPDHAGLVG
jgi:peptide chain release factor 3